MRTKILNLIKNGGIGPSDVVDCEFVYETFVPSGEIFWEGALVEMRDCLYAIIMDSSHPTLNPFMDDLFRFKKDNETFKETLLTFLKENVKSTTEKCDQKNDVMTMKIRMEILVINCLYFLDQEKITISSASIQTPLFKYNIEE